LSTTGRLETELIFVKYFVFYDEEKKVSKVQNGQVEVPSG
jgi:hypothetical protein